MNLSMNQHCSSTQVNVTCAFFTNTLSSAFIGLLVLCIGISALSYSTAASAQNALNCENNTFELSHRYPSGARWSVCANIDPDVGLRLTELTYQTPNGAPRRTFSDLHLAGLLEHYHNEVVERSIISEAGFGTTRVTSLTASTCPGELVSLGDSQNTLCQLSYPDKILAKFDNASVVQNENWELITTISDGDDVWEVIVTFGEEGSITPTVNRSGVVHRFTNDARLGSLALWNAGDPYAVNTTLLATWRMVPAFTSPASSHRVEQLDFALRPDLGNRRPMRSEILATETFRRINRDQFRRWRVYGSDGAGYAFDVQNNGFQFRSRRYNFALFDFAITAFNECEIINLRADPVDNCGNSLDDFINGESLDNRAPVLWFSQSMPIIIGAEDQPLMQTRSLSFTLTPFDWTQVSPFAPSDSAQAEQ